MNTIQFDPLYEDYRCDVAEENYEEFSKMIGVSNGVMVAILLRNTNYKAIIRKKKLNEILHNQHEV